MSLIRQTYDAVNRVELNWATDHLPPDFELIATAGSGERFVGPEGIARWFSELEEAWETTRTDVEEVVDFGERVIVLGRIRNKGRGSGIEIDVVAAHLWTVENGVPMRVELIGDREEALRRGAAESSREGSP